MSAAAKLSNYFDHLLFLLRATANSIAVYKLTFLLTWFQDRPRIRMARRRRETRLLKLNLQRRRRRSLLGIYLTSYEHGILYSIIVSMYFVVTFLLLLYSMVTISFTKTSLRLCQMLKVHSET